MSPCDTLERNLFEGQIEPMALIECAICFIARLSDHIPYESFIRALYNTTSITGGDQDEYGGGEFYRGSAYWNAIVLPQCDIPSIIHIMERFMGSDQWFNTSWLYSAMTCKSWNLQLSVTHPKNLIASDDGGVTEDILSTICEYMTSMKYLISDENGQLYVNPCIDIPSICYRVMAVIISREILHMHSPLSLPLSRIITGMLFPFYAPPDHDDVYDNDDLHYEHEKHHHHLPFGDRLTAMQKLFQLTDTGLENIGTIECLVDEDIPLWHSDTIKTTPTIDGNTGKETLNQFITILQALHDSPSKCYEESKQKGLCIPLLEAVVPLREAFQQCQYTWGKITGKLDLCVPRNLSKFKDINSVWILAHLTPSNSMDATIFRWFEECVKKMNDTQVRQLIRFGTGSFSIKFNGTLTIDISIGIDTDSQLPTSHTCINTICLPGYSSMEKMWKALQIAISCDSGFGFM
jgi:hypothetical protein